MMTPYAPGAVETQPFCLVCTVVVGEMAADGVGQGLACSVGISALLRVKQA